MKFDWQFRSSITIKYSRFESVTRQTPLIDYINEYEIILSTAKYLFDKIIVENLLDLLEFLLK